MVALTSKGGGIYRQERIGLNGKPFHILKFRTMFVNSDQKGLLTVGKRDPRVTPVGYYLRKYKLDEFPQLLNVFKGDMSLVGPRPEVSKYVALYNDEQKKVLKVRPGITDYASILFRNENELLDNTTDPHKTYLEEILPKKLELNIQYVNNHTIAEDFRIILQTFKRILF
jgi:lipopolysaccharide/colanic/teichoic acid biosynthesis glycosyltransferase